MTRVTLLRIPLALIIFLVIMRSARARTSERCNRFQKAVEFPENAGRPQSTHTKYEFKKKNEALIHFPFRLCEWRECLTFKSNMNCIYDDCLFYILHLALHFV